MFFLYFGSRLFADAAKRAVTNFPAFHSIHIGQKRPISDRKRENVEKRQGRTHPKAWLTNGTPEWIR